MNFLEIMKLMYTKPRQFKYHSKSKSLSRNQKFLILSFFDIRKGKQTGVFEKLRDKSFSNPLENGIRLYLLALCFNNNSKYSFAQETLSEASMIFSQIEFSQFDLYCLCDFITISANRSVVYQSTSQYEKLLTYETKNNYDENLKQSNLALYELYVAKYESCIHRIKEYFQSNSVEDVFYSSFALLDFRLNIFNKQFSKARISLERFKSAKTNLARLNYKYMKMLLDYLELNKPIYFYESDFEGHPELLQQLGCISSLANLEMDKACAYWSELKKHNPKSYLNNYVFLESKELFAQCLDKSLKASGKQVEVKTAELNGKKPLEKLEYILANDIKQITKKRLIELIWGDLVEEKSLKRLSGLIARYKEKHGVKLENYKDSYKKVS